MCKKKGTYSSINRGEITTEEVIWQQCGILKECRIVKNAVVKRHLQDC
jgi:hypothetical protein